MIELVVNGKPVELDGPTRLLDYLHDRGVDWQAIAVELNGVILRRDEYSGQMLQAADTLEIVRMVGGGKG